MDTGELFWILKADLQLKMKMKEGIMYVDRQTSRIFPLFIVKNNIDICSNIIMLISLEFYFKGNANAHSGRRN